MDAGNNAINREEEWFVPKLGPTRLRILAGLLFLPYTGMVLSFAVMGSMLARTVYWDRVAAIVVIYFFGLGIGAHALDALGSKNIKPWGSVFSRLQLSLMAGAALLSAYIIAVYYIIVHVPLLVSMALIEGFFVFAYNLEWFGGTFHNDRWFAFSWGMLPVLAGYIMQTNNVSVEAFAVSIATGLFGLVEIKASRPYKELRRRSALLGSDEKLLMTGYEVILKSISLGVISLGIGLLIWQAAG